MALHLKSRPAVLAAPRAPPQRAHFIWSRAKARHFSPLPPPFAPFPCPRGLSLRSVASRRALPRARSSLLWSCLYRVPALNYSIGSGGASCIVFGFIIALGLPWLCAFFARVALFGLLRAARFRARHKARPFGGSRYARHSGSR